MKIKIDEDALDEVPNYVKALIHYSGYDLWAPDDQNSEAMPYEHVRRGLCMLCGEPLKENTIVMANEEGVIGLWCNGLCLLDMHVLSWLDDVQMQVIARTMKDE